MREHEVEPLHALAHDRREVLVERGLPLLGAIVEDDVAALQQPVGVGTVFLVVFERARIERRLGVVVAVDEQLLDMLAVGTPVAGEHGAPDVAERAQFGNGAVLREVAARHHSVGLARVHVLERVAQHVRAVLIRRQEVDVADHPDPRERCDRTRGKRRGDDRRNKNRSKFCSRFHDLAILRSLPEAVAKPAVARAPSPLRQGRGGLATSCIRGFAITSP